MSTEKPAALQSRIGLLAVCTPAQRQLALTLSKGAVQSATAAQKMASRLRKEIPGLVIARDLAIAYGAVEEMRRYRSAKRERDSYRARDWYGPRRRAVQRSEDVRRSDARQSLAVHLAKPIRWRLETLRENLVLTAARAVMRHGASGGSRFIVRCGQEPGYEVVTEKDWTRVNKGRDTWASLVDRHQITVAPRWLGARRRIGDGSGKVDGRFLLDAGLFLESGDRAIWEARLARTGRGFQAVVEGAWLSCYGRDVTVHKNLKAALAAKPPAPPAPLPAPEDAAALADLAV